MIKIRCIDCNRIHVYKANGGRKRLRCNKCDRTYRSAYQRAYNKQWRENNRERRREYNKKWYAELKKAILGFEQMKLGV
jgi:DNA-directed RNA polymerase subunit M/transcription elongation factor TFIIS